MVRLPEFNPHLLERLTAGLDPKGQLLFMKCDPSVGPNIPHADAQFIRNDEGGRFRHDLHAHGERHHGETGQFLVGD